MLDWLNDWMNDEKMYANDRLNECMNEVKEWKN